MKIKPLISLFLLALTFSSLYAQAKSPRAVIDSLRWGFDYKSAEAVRRANQAKNLDSTYYVGYLIEAYHYFEKSEERTGLAKAAIPFRKAIQLYEKDFAHTLNKRYTKEEIYTGAWKDMFKQLDYYDINRRLINCYNTLEKPDSAYNAIRHFMKADLVFDFDSYHWLAWLYFRSRIYTTEKYPFLKGSLEENLSTAFSYVDSLQARYDKNTPFIRANMLGAFQPGSGLYNSLKAGFVEGPLNVINNTLGILYGYNFEPEKAAKYFKRMSGDGIAKPVNLGYTYHSNIDLATSAEYFGDVPDKGSRSRGGHWQGYSTIFVYQGNALAGALKLREERDKHGFTIGYGWDNLCLARMYLYGGLINECETALNSADKFSDVHYNTSFREDQYRFMLKALGLVKNHYQIQQYKFEHKNRWLSWEWWKNMPGLYYEDLTKTYKLADELAVNPEREMVYYHIFHSESIISFDELWFILKNYSREFFISTFKEFTKTDPRQNLKRYYRYFTGMMVKEDGDSEKAYDVLASILSDPKLDKSYEKLLIGRVHEACAELAIAEGWAPQASFHVNELYRVYPQLIPYSDVQMGFHLSVSGNTTEKYPQVKTLIEELDEYNINWSPDEGDRFPTVKLSVDAGGTLIVQVEVDRDIVASVQVNMTDKNATEQVAYGIFSILR